MVEHPPLPVVEKYRKERTNVKSLTIGFLLLLVVALAARQGTNSTKADDSKKNQTATVQPSDNTPAYTNKTVTADNTNPHEQKTQPQATAGHQSKLPLNLGSMPCPLDDQQCRAREKEKLAEPDEHL